MITYRRRFRFAWASALAALLLALAACGGSPPGGASSPSGTGSKDATQVRVLLDWFPNPDHAGLYTAESEGFFKDEGLNVNLTPPSNPADPLKLVAAGQVPLGISYEPDIISAKAEGLHVTAVAAVIPVALNSLMAPDTSPIKSPGQLSGHTVGTAGLPSDDLYLEQIFSKYGIQPSSVKKVNVGSDLVAAMISNSVDATVGGYRNIEAVQLQDRGLNPMIIPVTDAGVPQYNELVLVANSDKLRTDANYQDTVRRFIAALAKGTETAIAQPKVAEAAMGKVTKGYSPQLVTKMVDATTPLLKNSHGFGVMDPASWQSFADWMQRQGAIKAKIEGPTVVTNEYLPK